MGLYVCDSSIAYEAQKNLMVPKDDSIQTIEGAYAMCAKNETVPEGWFKCERPGLDFPFYNDETVPMWQGWLLAGVSLFVAVTLNVPYTILLVVARGNMFTVIKKPIARDILLALGVALSSIVYAFVMGSLLRFGFGIEAQANPAVAEAREPGFYLPFLLQLFGEELFKTNLMLGCILLVFRRTGDRKAAVIFAGFVTLMVFGLSHWEAYRSLAHVILIQGLGSFPFVYAYVKTKNILVTYAAHLVYDLISFGIAFLSAALNAGALL